MTGAIDRMHWLNTREDAPLLMHAVCGDWLAPPDHKRTWFAPARVSRGEHVLMFCYESEHTSMALCAALPKAMSAAWVTHLRAQLCPAGAEAKWAHFVGQLGRYEHIATAPEPLWAETPLIHDAELWRVRRRCHPSALIDRLLLRDRAEAEENLQAALSHHAAPAAAVGESPRVARRANVGDKRSE